MADMFRSQRLTYRAVEDEDDAFFTSLLKDFKGNANASIFLLKPPSKKDGTGYREWCQSCALGVIMCLPDANEEKPIGIITLKGPDVPNKMEHHRRSVIGIQIIEGYQGKGYGSEAIWWILNWGFQFAGFHRIAIATGSWNTGAARLYERLGFVSEGREREAFWKDGKWWDSLNWSMLLDEWKEKVSAKDSNAK